MYVLLVDIQLKAGAETGLVQTFVSRFKPAIAAQPGFVRSDLLQSCGDAGAAVLLIAFESRDVQQAWIATDLHAAVWPAMEEHAQSYAVRDFGTVD